MANDKKKRNSLTKRKKEKGKENNENETPEEPPPPTPPFKRLFSFATKLDIILIFLGTISSAAAGATMPLLIVLLGNSIDTFNSNDLNKLYDNAKILAIKMVVVGAIAFFAYSIQRICWSYASERQIEAMRIAYLKSILRQDISYFDKTGTGTLTSQIVSNTQLMQDAIGEKLGLVIQYTSTFVAGIVIGFIFYWKLTLVVMATLPLMAGIGAAFGLIFTKSEEKAQAAYASAGSIANEMISSMRTVQSFNLHEVALEKYSAKITEARKVAIQKGLYSGLSIGAIYFIFFASYSLDFWYGGKLLVSGQVSGGDVLIVILNVIIASFNLGSIASSLDTISKGLGASSSFFSILDRVPSIDSDSPAGVLLSDCDGSLSLNNVHFRYPTRPNQKILDGISLEIPAGYKVALVGPSGSGKSSIIQLLQRFYDPEEGEVTLGGHNVKSLNTAWLRYQFGIVGQEPALFSGTIRENIAFGCHEEVTQEEIETAARAALAHDFILTFPFGYDTQVGERGAQLSGGQKQRIAIARAILKNPKILLLDEATSALDSRSERKVQLALDNAAEGRTTIIIAHRLSTVKNADIIAVISKGTIVELGTHSQLLEQNGTYANLVRIQVGGKIDTKEDETIEELVKEEEEDQVEVVVQKEALKQEIKAEKSKMPWKQIFNMSRPEAVPLMLGALGSVTIGIINPLQSIFFAKIFTSYFLPSDQIMDHLRPWLLVYVGLAVGMLIAYTLQGYYFGYAGQHLVFRCRLESFKSILRQEIGWFDKKENSTGALTGKLASEAAQVEGALGAPLGSFVTCAASLVTGVTIAFLYSWRLAWVLTLAFPALLFGGFIEMYSVMPANVGKHEALLSANIVATEAISNVRTVASYVNESRMVAKYSEELLKPKEKSLKQSVMMGLLLGFGQFSVMSVNALGFWYGAKLIHDGKLNFQDFFTGFEAFMLTAQSISIALNMSSSFTKASSGAKQIFALINKISKIDAQSETGTAPEKEEVQGKLTFKNVEFSYPTRPDLPILQGLNLEIRPNEVTALVGASGCGKSSCIGLIERWYDPSEGKVKLDGVDIKKYNIQWLRKTIALVGQEPVLFSGTIAENIAYSVENATLEEIEEAAKSANAHNFISQFPDGYRTQVGEKGLQLSGGQKQRIAIARAIIKKPIVLLLDEATSALDTESEEIVQQALDNVMQGLTIVVIAHRLSTIRRANHIAVIDHGIVIEQGTHDELIGLRGHYFRLVQAQTS